jgi:hypothetical protein
MRRRAATSPERAGRTADRMGRMRVQHRCGEWMEDREVGGIFFTVDMASKKLTRFTDYGVVPMPPVSEKSTTRMAGRRCRDQAHRGVAAGRAQLHHQGWRSELAELALPFSHRPAEWSGDQPWHRSITRASGARCCMRARFLRCMCPIWIRRRRGTRTCFWMPGNTS